MQNKKKIDNYEKDREKWNVEQKSKIETNDQFNRTFYGGPTIGGIVVFLVIIIVIIINIIKH
ncbi:hypothetical protein ACIQ4I_01535 [Rummeliibacillus sp. NPDC094406]|uniref:hypothetical protein n=1 Tax=Rummeliibacillus sp. NPDC094406 TaxID=3364511 RepID=UPI003800F14D